MTSCEASVDREALSGLLRKTGTRSLACLVFEASSNGEAPYIQEQGSWPVLFLVLKQVEVEKICQYIEDKVLGLSPVNQQIYRDLHPKVKQGFYILT